MKIPDTLKIGGQIYTIIKSDRCNDNGIAQIGTHDGTRLKIWIDTCSEIPQTMQESILIHEILESINYLNELDLSHTQLEVLEHNLYQVLKDNMLLRED